MTTTGRHHQKEGNQNGETMSPPCDSSPTVSPPEQSTAVAGEAALSTISVREEDAEVTDNTTALSLSSDSSSDAPPAAPSAAARVPKSTPAPGWKKSAPKASTPMRNRTKKSVVIDVDEWQEQRERQRLSSSGVDSSSSAATATATTTTTTSTKEDVGFQDSKPPAQSVSSSSTSTSVETEKLNETIDSIAQFGENDASSSAVASSNSDNNAKVTAAQHKIVTADEQLTQESSQHRSTTAAVGGSYAARLARKQREMALNNDLGSEISSPNNNNNHHNNSLDRRGDNRTVATAARSTEGAAARNTETRPGDTIANSRYTAGATGKRAMMGNVQAEITEAQSRARQARENRKQAQSQAEAAASAAQTPLRPPSSCVLSSKAAMVQSGATPAHNSNSTSQTYYPSDTARATTLDSDAVSITHSQAALSTSSATTGSGSQDQQAAASQASSMESSLQQQPGAYPTAGRAPFANPYMGGRYRLGGGDPALSGEAITTQNNQNQGGHPFNESVSTLAMTDMSYSQQTRMGTSSHHPPVAIGSTGVRRRLESSGDMEEEEDPSTSHNTTNSQDPHNYDLGESTDDAHNNPGEIVAVCVEEDDLENNIRDEIIRSAAQADVVQDNSQKDKIRRALYGIVVIVLILLIIGISVGFLVRKEEGGSDDGFVPDLDEIVDENVDGIADENATIEAPSQSPTTLFRQTLEKVQEAGILRCGIYETSGFDEASGERFGVDADWVSLFVVKG